MVQIQIQGVITLQVAQRRLDVATRAGLIAAVEHWHEHMMPGHFELSASKKYGYVPRTAKYMRFKARAYHHQRPLVLTGQSERMAKQMVRLSTRKRRAGIVAGEAAMTLPKYFYQYRLNAKKVDKADELTRTVADERLQLSNIVRTRLIQVLLAGTATPAVPAGAAVTVTP